MRNRSKSAQFETGRLRRAIYTFGIVNRSAAASTSTGTPFSLAIAAITSKPKSLSLGAHVYTIAVRSLKAA